jgi:Zn-dependent protease
MLDFTFSILILIMSVVIHEVAHGYSAYLQGDNTAKFMGRLTLNPLKHLEWFGSFILPVISYLTGGFIIGWAKPVPFNPYNLRNQRWGEALVAISGPAINFFIATVFGLALRFGIGGDVLSAPLVSIFSMIVRINIILATFNLVPLPPLDGSKILFAVFPLNPTLSGRATDSFRIGLANSLWQMRRNFEKYGILLALIFVFFFSQLIVPIVGWEYQLITGLSFL